MSEDFMDHGVATPVSNHRGTVATVDGAGRNVVLLWLFDHRGGYAILVIDAETGKSKEIPMPFPSGSDCPYASILSSRNRFYTHFNGYFVEFDPIEGEFTFCRETAPQMAMGMTEDDSGVIWSVTYPDSGVVSFDPEARRLRDYGHLYRQNWRQYPRFVAADEAGWIYFGIGNTATQIIALDPDSGRAEPLLQDSERHTGIAYVYRDVNGKVYGLPVNGMEEGWLELYGGRRSEIGRLHARREKPIITGSQGLFHADFPDGGRLLKCDLVDHLIAVQDPTTGKITENRFEYSSEGAHVMGMAASPDGTICGGTAFPMRFFSYDPVRDAWTNRACFGQWNTVARQGDRFFVGAYSGGFLLEWDPSQAWIPTEKGTPDSNPRLLHTCNPSINRPHALLAYPDGRTIVMAGTPDYGYTGGGLFFWDRERRTGTLIEHTNILPEHSTMSLAALPGGRLLGGTTTSPGTGGEQKARQAELYVMDVATGRLEWHEALFPGAQAYTDLHASNGGNVFGFTDRKRFFVFDPRNRAVLHEQETAALFGPTTAPQGPRVFVPAPDGSVYILFARGIARLDPATFRIAMLAQSPVPIDCGGDLMDGRIYFGSGSHLYSYRVSGRPA